VSTLNSRTFNQVHWNWPAPPAVVQRIVPICLSGEWATYSESGAVPVYTASGEWVTYNSAGSFPVYLISGEYPLYEFSADLEC
jgi:hypothetical protein